jgi:hypothetical protein
MAETAPSPLDDPPSERVCDLAVRRGRDAMSFLAVESGMRHWFDGPTDGRSGACVAYVDTSTAWVAACGPLIEAATESYEGVLSDAALRFVREARAHRRRVCFFGCESLVGAGLGRLLIGEQPIFRPAEWLRELPGRRRLREQLRRARAKGLQVRAVSTIETMEGAPLRREIERLAEEWLRSRHIEPMGFVVALEPFQHPPRHRYFVAELGDRVVGFLSAVPIGGENAWLVEDVIRSADAPNGTTETLLVALMRAVEDSAYVTLGLTPLSGAVMWPLRVVRWVSRPLFDFAGLRAFRERLRPDAWEPIWLVYPQGDSAVVAVVDSLRAFARGSLVGFATRSFARHPSGLPWLLALPLPVWTLALAALVATRRSVMLGFDPISLAAWVLFDAVLLLVLVRAALRPSSGRMVFALSLALGDALVSAAHLFQSGLGHTPLESALRGLATVAPVAGTLLLAWATTRAAPAKGARPGSGRHDHDGQSQTLDALLDGADRKARS